MGEIKEIKIERIIFSKINPRKEFNKNSIQELADSIKAIGLRQPILVRPIGKDYELVYGQRRLKACKLNKAKTIRAEIERLTDEQVFEISLVENLQRQDVHPLDEANFISAMLETGKFTIETIASKIGKSKSYVIQRFYLTKLIPDLRKEYSGGKIELGHAILCAKMPEKEQQKILSYIKRQFHMPTVNALKAHISTNLLINLNEAPFNRKDKLLLETAGSCTECPKRTGNAEDLFSDYSGKNLCPDAGCYKLKLDIHIDRLIAKHEEAKKELIKISDKNHDTKKDVWGWNDYEVIKKAEGKNIKHAVYMDGPKKGHLVNIRKKEPEKPAEPKQPSIADMVAEENEKIKAKRDGLLRQALAAEILGKDLKTEILPQIARAILNMENGEFLQEYFYLSENSNMDFVKMKDETIIETFNGGAIAAASNPDFNYPIEFLIKIADKFEINHKAIKDKVWNENHFVTADDIKKRMKKNNNAATITEENKDNIG